MSVYTQVMTYQIYGILFASWGVLLFAKENVVLLGVVILFMTWLAVDNVSMRHTPQKNGSTDNMLYLVDTNHRLFSENNMLKRKLVMKDNSCHF